jgi:glycosyltransferase involved in cell wall biosynthesis
MEVSVIIPTYNKKERLKLALTSFINQTYPRDKFEVVLIDDGSTDGTESMVRSLNLPFKINYIRQPNQGRSKARNLGIAYAKGKIIIFTDDDLILSPEFIEEHVRHHKKRSKLVVHGTIYTMSFLKFFKDPIRGILLDEFKEKENVVSGLRRRCICEEDILNNFEKIKVENKKLTRFEIGIHQMLSDDGINCVSPWIGFTGGNVSVRKYHLIRVGGFDENIGKTWGGEDLELGYRLYKYGCKFVLGKKAVNYHIAHYREDFMRIHKKTHELFYKKHKCIEVKLLWDYFEKKIKTIKEYSEMVLERRKK